MRDRTPTPAQAAWRHSRRLREIGAAALRAFNAKRLAGPRCGAKKRTDGEPCKNPAGENGRCRLHGGATPKRDVWHVRQWPNKTHPKALEKAEAKIRDGERADRKRRARLAAMTPEELEAYEAWQRAHRPGPAAERVLKRTDRRAAEQIKAAAEPSIHEKSQSEEAARRSRLLAKLRAQQAADEAKRPQGAFS